MNQGAKLDFSSLQRAVHSLEEALAEHQRLPDNTFVRDACIQRFEYTYELSHKMLRRYLESISSSSAEIDDLSFQDLIRTGWEKKLLQNSWDAWKLYRKARGTTSHTYDEKKAKEVLTIVPEFYREAAYLLQQLLRKSA